MILKKQSEKFKKRVGENIVRNSEQKARIGTLDVKNTEALAEIQKCAVNQKTEIQTRIAEAEKAWK